MASPVSAAASPGGSSVSSITAAAASPTNSNSVTITTTASTAPTASVSSPTSASSGAGVPPALSSSCRGVYLDVLRSAARLTLQHGAELKEEVRGIMRQAGKGSRRGPQQAQEPVSSLALLVDLQALATWLQEVGFGCEVGSSHAAAALGAAGGGGAVPVEPGEARKAAEDEKWGARGLGGGVAVGGPGSLPQARELVLGNVALMHVLMTFLVDGSARSRKMLGDLGVVCRQWRELTATDMYWRPIARELFPRLGSDAYSDEGLGTEEGEEGEGNGNGGEDGEAAKPADWHRRYVLQYGRCLVDRPIRMGPWHEGITLSFDLHDESDGLRLFSSTGPIRFTGTTIAGITAMKLTGRRRRVTTPFSAATRDPPRSLSSIEELFVAGDQPNYRVSMCVRVTARDQRTGRMALLFTSSKRAKRWVEPLGPEMGVPEGTLLVNQGWTRVTVPSTDLAMQMLTVFYVAPVDGQEELTDPAERMYAVLTLDCAFMLQCKTEDQEAIGRFILAALRHAPEPP